MPKGKIAISIALCIAAALALTPPARAADAFEINTIMPLTGGG